MVLARKGTLDMNGIVAVKTLMVLITLGLGWFAWGWRNKPVHSYVFWNSVLGIVAAGTLGILFIV